MSETLLIAEPPTESPSAETAAAPHRVRRIPMRRPRRFRSNLRFNGLRYFTLACSLGLTWGLVRFAMWRGAGMPDATFALVLAGGLLAAAAKTGLDLLKWAEENRQAIHAERVRAVQRVFQRALAVREQAALDWRRIHTVLVDNLSGQSQEIRLFHDHDGTDREAKKLLEKALTEELWLRTQGVDAVRAFKSEIAALDYRAFGSESEFLAAFNGLMHRLRQDLAVAVIGIPLD